MEVAYSKASLMTALYGAMSVSFCLPHPVAVSVFISPSWGVEVCCMFVMDVVFSVCIVMRVGARVWGSMTVLSCRCMFVSCVHPVAVLNAA